MSTPLGHWFISAWIHLEESFCIIFVVIMLIVFVNIYNYTNNNFFHYLIIIWPFCLSCDPRDQIQRTSCCRDRLCASSPSCPFCIALVNLASCCCLKYPTTVMRVKEELLKMFTGHHFLSYCRLLWRLTSLLLHIVYAYRCFSLWLAAMSDIGAIFGGRILW